MKFRKGFISNSSSTYFVVEKKNLTPDQITLLLNLPSYCKNNDIPVRDWQIEDCPDVICGGSVLGKKEELVPLFIKLNIDNFIEWKSFLTKE